MAEYWDRERGRRYRGEGYYTGGPHVGRGSG